jgi:uncharacterized protein (TIGR02246 family)
MKRRLLAAAGLVLGLTASASAQDKNGQCTGSEDACRQVAMAIRDFENAFNKHDAASIASLFSEDAVLLPEGPMLSGRDAIQKFYAGALDAGLTGLVFNVKETHILSDVAWSIGDWHVDGPGPNHTSQVHQGNWFNLFVRSGNTWKIRQDTFNSMAPP